MIARKFVLLFCIIYVNGYTQGPNVCLPPFSAPHLPANPPTDKKIEFALYYGKNLTGYYPGVTHTLIATSDQNIKGFLLWVEDANMNRVGTISSFQPNTQDAYSFNLDDNCNTGDTLGHSGEFDQIAIVANWVAPGKGTGPVTFNMVQVVDINDNYMATSSMSWVELTGPPPVLATSLAPPTFMTYPPSLESVPTLNVTYTGLGTAAVGGGLVSSPFSLSNGAIAGIAVASVCLIVIIVGAAGPVLVARAMKDDPRVKRMTNRFTSGRNSGFGFSRQSSVRKSADPLTGLPRQSDIENQSDARKSGIIDENATVVTAGVTETVIKSEVIIENPIEIAKDPIVTEVVINVESTVIKVDIEDSIEKKGLPESESSDSDSGIPSTESETKRDSEEKK